MIPRYEWLKEFNALDGTPWAEVPRILHPPEVVQALAAGQPLPPRPLQLGGKHQWPRKAWERFQIEFPQEAA